MLSAYTIHDLQMFAALLTEFEKRGSTDVRFIREAVFKKLHAEQARLITGRMRAVRAARKSDRRCPSCGGMLFPVANNEGLKIAGCRKCRYSELI